MKTLETEGTLTRAGRKLGVSHTSVARSMPAQLDSLDRQPLGSDARLSGRLHLSTMDVFASFHAAELGASSRRFPAVELEVRSDNRPMSMTRREADVAIRFSNAPPEHLVGRKLGHDGRRGSSLSEGPFGGHFT